MLITYYTLSFEIYFVFYTCSTSPLELTTCQVCNNHMWLVLVGCYYTRQHDSITYTRKTSP